MALWRYDVMAYANHCPLTGAGQPALARDSAAFFFISLNLRLTVTKRCPSSDSDDHSSECHRQSLCCWSDVGHHFLSSCSLWPMIDTLTGHWRRSNDDQNDTREPAGQQANRWVRWMCLSLRHHHGGVVFMCISLFIKHLISVFKINHRPNSISY